MIPNRKDFNRPTLDRLHELKAENQQLREAFIDQREVLIMYSEWLEKQGYTDTDWRTEEPFAIDEFLKQLTKGK